jgi:hypothetical protein
VDPKTQDLLDYRSRHEPRREVGLSLAQPSLDRILAGEVLGDSITLGRIEIWEQRVAHEPDSKLREAYSSRIISRKTE